MLSGFAAPPAAGVRGLACQPAARSDFQAGISAVAYVPFPASGPPSLRRLPGWRPALATPLVGGGRWAGPGAWRTSKLACGEGWPCSAGRRLVLPDGGLQLLPREGSRRTGSGVPSSPAEGLAALLHEVQDNLTCTCFLSLHLKNSLRPLCTFFFVNREGEGRKSSPPPLPSPELQQIPFITLPRWQTPSWIFLMTQTYLAWTL